MNPNTGEPVDEWQCAVNLLPVLLIENSQQQRSTGAAVESLRNETAKQGGVINQVLTHAVNLSLLPPSPIEETSVEVL